MLPSRLIHRIDVFFEAWKSMRLLLLQLAVGAYGFGGGAAYPYGLHPGAPYDASSARDYYGRRPWTVAGRSLEILWRSAGFGASVQSAGVSSR